MSPQQQAQTFARSDIRQFAVATRPTSGNFDWPETVKDTQRRYDKGISEMATGRTPDGKNEVLYEFPRKRRDITRIPFFTAKKHQAPQ